MHVAGDALDEVLDRHRGAEVGAVAGALVGRVIDQGAAVGQLKGDWKELVFKRSMSVVAIS